MQRKDVKLGMTQLIALISKGHSGPNSDKLKTACIEYSINIAINVQHILGSNNELAHSSGNILSYRTLNVVINFNSTKLRLSFNSIDVHIF